MEKLGLEMRTSSLSRLTSSSNLLILSSYPAFSSLIKVVSASVSHHSSRALRSSRTADNCFSIPRTRISPDVSALTDSNCTSSPASTLFLPANAVDLVGGDDTASVTESVARCLPFSVRNSPDTVTVSPPPATRSPRLPDSSPTDSARDRWGIGVGGGGRSGELDGPATGTS
ncbi:hypothetical protein BGW80DRAFT_290208 [Lactifluus volemus]|nr:hypothetical protein BGW80DRAFT_290208 [Lactifluus volemus]